jgi:biotin-dependent carboxylase-like uncharacterized protein
MLRLMRAGPLTTVQDRGRTGLMRFGITPAGPMDWIAFATALSLIDAPPDAATVEIGPAGLTLLAEAPQRVALAAPGFRVTRDGTPLPSRIALTLRAGQTLDVTPGPSGVWGYLALPGGVDAPVVMGSRATHLRAGLGRALAAGDMLTARGAADGPDLALIPPPAPDTPIRLLPGPQADHFAPAVAALLTAATWRVGRKSDRMAFRLEGPALPAEKGHDIVSDGIPMGAVQVPGDGQPLCLMADRQPTGGYPKIACVITADLPRLAQTRPGESLRFALVTHDAAIAALHDAHAWLSDLPRHRRLLRLPPASTP